MQGCVCVFKCVFSPVTDPTEVYTWGNNTNFSLGHGNQESRQHPELVDVFARTGVYIKQVGVTALHHPILDYNIGLPYTENTLYVLCLGHMRPQVFTNVCYMKNTPMHTGSADKARHLGNPAKHSLPRVLYYTTFS